MTAKFEYIHKYPYYKFLIILALSGYKYDDIHGKLLSLNFTPPLINDYESLIKDIKDSGVSIPDSIVDKVRVSGLSIVGRN